MKFHVMLGTLLFVGSGVAQAADMPAPQGAVAVMPQEPGSPWSVSIAPYVWASGISGDIGSFGLPPVHLDASFSDILKNFDIGAMFVGEIRYQRYGLFTDFIYVKISGSKGTPIGLAAGSVNVDTKTLTATIAPEYRLVETPRGSLDVMAGARIWSVDTDVSFSGGLLNGRSASDGDTWVDPLIGVKGRLDLGRNFYLTAWGMIGGFGVLVEVHVGRVGRCRLRLQQPDLRGHWIPRPRGELQERRLQVRHYPVRPGDRCGHKVLTPFIFANGQVAQESERPTPKGALSLVPADRHRLRVSGHLPSDGFAGRLDVVVWPRSVLKSSSGDGQLVFLLQSPQAPSLPLPIWIVRLMHEQLLQFLKFGFQF